MICCDICSKKIDTDSLSAGEREDLLSFDIHHCNDCMDEVNKLREEHNEWMKAEKEKIDREYKKRIAKDFEELRKKKL